MSSEHDAVVDALCEEYGSAVRAIATYDHDDYTLLYAGETVHDEYTPIDVERIYDDLVIQDFNHGFQEELFGDMGAVRGKFRLFAGGTVAHFWPTDDDAGLFVAFDDSADPGARTLLDIVEEYYA